MAQREARRTGWVAGGSTLPVGHPKQHVENPDRADLIRDPGFGTDVKKRLVQSRTQLLTQRFPSPSRLTEGAPGHRILDRDESWPFPREEL